MAHAVGQLYADKIVAGRPFQTLDEVVSRRIMPSAAFKEIRPQLFFSWRNGFTGPR